jgi:hypothetical protein
MRKVLVSNLDHYPTLLTYVFHTRTQDIQRNPNNSIRPRPLPYKLYPINHSTTGRFTDWLLTDVKLLQRRKFLFPNNKDIQ